MNIASNYLTATRKIFEYYQTIGRKAILQLTNEQLHRKYHPYDNNAATIIKHMVGNMKSRFTNFLNEDGEKPWRNREMEFVDTLLSKEDILKAWDEGWNLLLDTIDQITEEDLENQIVYIRNIGHSIIEALNRQLGHYAYHTGQLVYLAKSLSGEQWQSVSIPAGESESYNLQKFSQHKTRKFFADDFIGEEE